MSIKGTLQELYVGKKESNIISLWGSKKLAYSVASFNLHN